MLDIFDMTSSLSDKKHMFCFILENKKNNSSGKTNFNHTEKLFFIYTGLFVQKSGLFFFLGGECKSETFFGGGGHKDLEIGGK